jgi:ATP-dependent DNA helicase RecG
MRDSSRAETKGLTRMENRDYPEEALREALLNALVHRDYSFSSGILVSVFDDRIEIVSVGGLVKGVSLDDVKLGLSIHRNEKLADVFCRLRLTGACGTGISKIMRSYADCFKKPKLKAAGNAFKITLPNKNVKGWGAGARASSFSANEKIVINLLNGKEVINRKDAEAALEGSQATAVRTLRSLVEKQAIRVIGGGKKTRYAKA